jgi:hypothetical protein
MALRWSDTRCVQLTLRLSPGVIAVQQMEVEWVLHKPVFGPTSLLLTSCKSQMEVLKQKHEQVLNIVA